MDENFLKDWPSDQLVVFAEHPSYFYDMMSRAMMNQVRPATLMDQSSPSSVV